MAMYITRSAHGLDASSDQRVTVRRTKTTLTEFRQGPAQSCMKKRFKLMAILKDALWKAARVILKPRILRHSSVKKVLYAFLLLKP